MNRTLILHAPVCKCMEDACVSLATKNEMMHEVHTNCEQKKERGERKEPEKKNKGKGGRLQQRRDEEERGGVREGEDEGGWMRRAVLSGEKKEKLI